MRCFHLQIDPTVVKGSNTSAYIYAPTAVEAKKWAEKRWHVSERLVKAEVKGKDNIPEGTKVVDLSREAAKAAKRKAASESAKQEKAEA